MKTLLLLIVIAFGLVGCAGLRKSGDIAAVRSERDYAAGSEALAQDLYKTGRAPSIEAARAEAAAAANQEWARAATAAERKQHQENFEKDLSKLDSGSK